MSTSARLASFAIVAALLAGCGDAPLTPAPSPASSAPGGPGPSPSDGGVAPPSPSEVAPGVSPSPTATPAATPSTSPSPTPTPDIGVSRIRWQRLPDDHPLSLARAETAWRGGYVAVARRLVAGEVGHNRVWVSSDGAAWTQLPLDTFGTTSAVLSVAATADGVVAHTADQGDGFGGPDAGSLANYDLIPPLQAWISGDGFTWTAHPLDGISPPDEMDGQDGDYPILDADSAPLLVVRQDRDWLAVSDDGLDWDPLAGEIPDPWMHNDVVRFGDGWIASGWDETGDRNLRSSDGHAWTVDRVRPRCAGPEWLAAGSEGLIASKPYLYTAVGGYDWCSSLDGSTWRRLEGYPPVGPSKAADECRDVCPDGKLAADGTLIVAYRFTGAQAAWASLDGRAWTRLAVRGTLPGRNVTDLRLLPLGLVARNGANQAAWQGVLR
jgi:hypothetical protein